MFQKTPSFNSIRNVLAATLCSLVAVAASAQSSASDTFPKRPVTIVVGYAPGGSNDIMARNVQQKMFELLGVPVVVDNRPGAGGVIGTNYVAHAPKDGHTLLLTWDAHIVNAVALKDLPYDTFKDLTPVVFLGRFPLLMMAGADVPANNLKEFVAFAKQQPGKLNFASVGAASATRLQAENLIALAGISVVHVPYKGAAPAAMAVMTGEVAFSFLSYGAVKGQIAAGKLKALAVTGSSRIPELPNVPTMAESGFPDSQGYSWVAIFAPAGTPTDVISQLNRTFNQALADPDVKKKLADSGFEPVGGTPKELDTYVHGEYDKWSKFVRQSHLDFEQ